MRIVLYILIIVLVFLAPVDRLDIAKLSPVEAVAVYREDGNVVLKTDEGSIGAGLDALAALENLKENTSAIVYLDTADYLLIGDGAEQAAEALRQYLRASIQTGKYAGGDVKEEAKYLDVHNNSAKPAG